MEHSAASEIEQDVDVETPDFPISQDETYVVTEWISLSETEMVDILNDPSNKPPQIDYDSIGEFCFESDQLALKGNSDYKNILEAVVVLEAQRAQAVKDLEKLTKLKKEALADPFEFLKRLQKKEEMNFPLPQKIHPVPLIDWSKYALSGNPGSYERRQINLHRSLSRNIAKDKSNIPIDENKSSELYLPWTEEEQKKLKELLVDYLPEEDEALRWEKIATDLKTRTPLEVAARVHKNYASLIKDDTIKLVDVPNLTFSRKDDEEISPELRDSAEYKELLFLKKLLREKVVEESNSLIPHVGYKCCRCKVEPIVGVRWHCTECPNSLCIDFCDDCSQSIHETDEHSADHHLEKVYASKGFIDRDYMHFLGNDYNYLDPNYMPAT